jgi:hypothetical protein
MSLVAIATTALVGVALAATSGDTAIALAAAGSTLIFMEILFAWMFLWPRTFSLQAYQRVGVWWVVVSAALALGLCAYFFFKAAFSG